MRARLFRVELQQHLAQATRTKTLNLLREARAAALRAESYSAHGFHSLLREAQAKITPGLEKSWQVPKRGINAAKRNRSVRRF
jgi:hypothetical protein